MSVNLRDFFVHYRGEPHQVAAVNLLMSQMPASLLKNDADWVVAFRAAPAAKEPLPRFTNPLRVPYYSQRDSQVPGQSARSCFSSSCAMLAAFLKPGVFSGSNADDAYLKRVLQHGDTTNAMAQLQALGDYGVKAVFRQNCDWKDLETQIAAGVPVPCGFLHHGSSTAPSGGGHWLTVVGITDSAVIVNDPWGEMNVPNGTYTSTKGACLAYSKKHWGPRWMAEGPGTGWAIIAER